MIRNSLHIKKNNLRVVLRTLLRSEGISKSRMASTLGVGVSTIAQIVDPLIDKGIIVMKDYGESSGGRRPVLLTINPDAAFSVCVDLSSHQVTVALLDCQLNIRGKTEFIFSDDEISWLPQLIDAIYQLMKQVNCQEILGVCVAISGVPNPITGEISSSLMRSLVGVPLAKILSDRLKAKVYVENDANLSAIGELMFSKEDVRNMFYIHMGEGLGGGVIIDGDIFRGDDGYTGEIGRMIYCTEKMTTVGEAYTEALNQKDESVKNSFIQRILSTVISNVRCAFDIKHYVVGGKYANFPESVLKKVEETVRNVFYGFDVKINKSKDSSRSILVGCAEFVLENEIYRL